MPELSISIVSHRQSSLIKSLLDDIQRWCSSSLIEVILTINVDEVILFDTRDYGFPIRIIHNIVQKGFGENHNAAFHLVTGNYYCVLNPDIRLINNPFTRLIDYASNHNLGLIAPRVINKEGVQEDSARKFPSIIEILRKISGGKSAIHDTIGLQVSNPDWVAGMFMLFPRDVFEKIGGFDERYFLYYEDVDLCARLTLLGYQVALCSSVTVIHDARRSSHKNLRYLRLHLTSMLRFFSSSVYRQLQRREGS